MIRMTFITPRSYRSAGNVFETVEDARRYLTNNGGRIIIMETDPDFPGECFDLLVQWPYELEARRYAIEPAEWFDQRIAALEAQRAAQ